MKTLYLLRHAKAERDSVSGEDFDRALAERGRGDAASLGRLLHARGWRPDLILASPSRRTMETIEQLTLRWPGPPTDLKTDAALYLAAPSRILTAVRALPDRAASAMLVGHNPGIEELAAMLAHGVPSDSLRRLQKNFPTCALAVFDISVEHWSRAAPELARLTTFFGPKDLADGSFA